MTQSIVQAQKVRECATKAPTARSRARRRVSRARDLSNPKDIPRLDWRGWQGGIPLALPATRPRRARWTHRTPSRLYPLQQAIQAAKGFVHMKGAAHVRAATRGPTPSAPHPQTDVWSPV